MAQRLPLSKPPASLCILRLSALGDVTHVVPVIRCLQKHWPETKLTWVIGQFEHQLVHDLEGVEFITYQKRKSGNRKAVAMALAGRRFDVLLNLQVAMRANLLSTLISADVRLGYDRARSKDFHSLFINHRIAEHPGEHVIDCFFGFLEALGIQDNQREWRIPIPEEASRFAETALPSDQRHLVISPCASNALRNWSAERYAAAADHAILQGMSVTLCGGPSEHEQKMGLEIEKAMAHKVHSLIGKLNLKQLLAVLARADLVISPDSGPAHIANAVGKPVIGLYVVSNPKRSGPYHSQGWWVDRYDEAAQAYRGKPASSLKWGTKLEYPGVMDLIEITAVTEKIDAYLEQNPL